MFHGSLRPTGRISKETKNNEVGAVLPQPDSQKAAHQAVLHDYGLLLPAADNTPNNTTDNTAFRNIVNLAANVFHTPIAMINIADLEHNCWRSHTTQGCDVIDCRAIDFDVDGSLISESFCQQVLDTRALIVSPSTVDDARFANLPSVKGEPHIHFYVGMPLTVPEGITVGSLCVMDTHAHPKPNANQLTMFAQLAQLAVNELGTQRTLYKQTTLERELLERDKTYRLVSQAFGINIYSYNVDTAGNFVHSEGNIAILCNAISVTATMTSSRWVVGMHSFILTTCPLSVNTTNAY